jgi:predicted transglutaminase-like cysteine proteinase
VVEAPPGFGDACRRYEWLCRTEPRAAPPLSDDQLLDLAARVNGHVNWTIAPWERSGYRLLARQSVANRGQWEALLPVAGQ